MAVINLQGVELWEAQESEWSGASDLMGQEQALDLCRIALGLPVGGFRRSGAADRVRFFPVLLGEPGMGKTTLAFQAAREAAAGRGVFMVHCNPDMMAEDLVATPVPGSDRMVRYQLSPFATAALRGAAVILDEASRLQPAAWASLMGAFDDRRCLVSVPAGVSLPVHDGFAVILTMNRDAETYELPPAMRSRLGPFITMRGLSRSQRVAMIRRTLSHLTEEAVTRGLEFLDEAVPAAEPLAPRDTISVFRFYDRLTTAWPGRSESQDLLRLSLELNRPGDDPDPPTATPAEAE